MSKDVNSFKSNFDTVFDVVQVENVRYITVILPLKQFINLNHMIYASVGSFNMSSFSW